MKERMSGDCLLMSKEGWKRTCPPGTTSRVLRRCLSLCVSTKCRSRPLGRAWQHRLPPWCQFWTSTQPGWGCGQELEKEGGRGGGDLKIVLISFLQLSFTVHKQARGLPAPVHTTPYIIGDRRASLGAGNRQGRDIYTALPKPMSSSRVPGPWKQPLGRGKAAGMAGRGWGGRRGKAGCSPGARAGLSVWAAGRKQAGAAARLLGQKAVRRGQGLWERSGKHRGRSQGVIVCQRGRCGSIGGGYKVQRCHRGMEEDRGGRAVPQEG